MVILRYIFEPLVDLVYFQETVRSTFFLLEFTPCKAEQPLQCMELQEKEAQND